VDNWKNITNSQNSVRKKSFGGTFSFSNCQIIGLDTGSLVLIVFEGDQVKWTTSTYQEFDEAKELLNRPKRPKKKENAPLPQISARDDSEGTIILFPGQGSQFIGTFQYLFPQWVAEKSFTSFSNATALWVIKIG
jgi:hypothetical protein